jgi:hypothetical protein
MHLNAFNLIDKKFLRKENFIYYYYYYFLAGSKQVYIKLYCCYQAQID